MPPLDGCGVGEIALILQSKPNLDGIKGFCPKTCLPNVYTFPGGPYEKLIPPSI